jgi:transmembrane sensor
MKDYSTYSAEDFAYDETFLKWVKYPARYPLLDKFWQNWLQENPHKKVEVEEARMMIIAVLQEKQFSPAEGKQHEVWNRIDKIIVDASPQVKQVSLWQRWYLRAAVISILVATGLFLWYPGNHETVLSENTTEAELFTEQINNSDLPKTIILSDETSIVLQPQSALQYPKTFDADIREVYLTGEAFFEVKKDANRPFLVHTHEIVTRVLGTSFTVRGYTNEKNVLVQVKTGKVSVFKNKDKRKSSPDEIVEGVVLMPNQQVLYERDEMKMTKSLVENPSVLVQAAKQNFEFIDTPITEVFEMIEQAYGVDIVFDEEVMANCSLNASLSDVPLYDKLKLICKVINTTYEIMDSHIIIYGKGCD